MPVRGHTHFSGNEREHCRRAGFVGRQFRQSGQTLVQIHASIADRLDGLQCQSARGESARFVYTDDIDPGQTLHGAKLLHHHLLASQAHHGRGHGDAHQQHQTLRHQRHYPRYCRHQPMRSAAATAQLTPYQQCRQGAHHPADVPQDLVNSTTQLGNHRIKRLGLLLQLMNPHVVAHTGGNHARTASHHGTAGSHLISHLLDHGVGFTGERRLIHFTAVDVGDLGIHWHLIADFQQDPVTRYQIPNRHCLFDTVTNHFYRGCHQDDEMIKRAFCSQFLEYADRCIGHHHQSKGKIDQFSHRNHHCGQHHYQCVESGEKVRLDNVETRTRRDLGNSIDLATGPSLRYFIRTEPLPVCGQRCLIHGSAPTMLLCHHYHRTRGMRQHVMERGCGEVPAEGPVVVFAQHHHCGISSNLDQY